MKIDSEIARLVEYALDAITENASIASTAQEELGLSHDQAHQLLMTLATVIDSMPVRMPEGLDLEHMPANARQALERKYLFGMALSVGMLLKRAALVLGGPVGRSGDG